MKYEILWNISKEIDGVKVYRIRALKDFSNVKAGDLGGYVEFPHNLSQNGDCWIYDEACVYGGAQVFNDAIVTDNAIMFGNASACNDAQVIDNAVVSGNARLFDSVIVANSAIVTDNAQLFGNAIASRCDKIAGDTRLYDNFAGGVAI